MMTYLFEKHKKNRTFAELNYSYLSKKKLKLCKIKIILIYNKANFNQFLKY